MTVTIRRPTSPPTRRPSTAPCRHRATERPAQAASPAPTERRCDEPRHHVACGLAPAPRRRTPRPCMRPALVLFVVGLGPMLLARQGRGHADPGHPAQAAGVLPARRRLGEPRRRVERRQIGKYFVNTILIAAGAWFVQLARRDNRRLCAVRPAPALRQGRHGLRARDPVRPRRRAARAAVPDDPRHRRSSARR